MTSWLNGPVDIQKPVRPSSRCTAAFCFLPAAQSLPAQDSEKTHCAAIPAVISSSACCTCSSQGQRTVMAEAQFVGICWDLCELQSCWLFVMHRDKLLLFHPSPFTSAERTEWGFSGVSKWCSCRVTVHQAWQEVCVSTAMIGSCGPSWQACAIDGLHSVSL